MDKYGFFLLRDKEKRYYFYEQKADKAINIQICSLLQTLTLVIRSTVEM